MIHARKLALTAVSAALLSFLFLPSALAETSGDGTGLKASSVDQDGPGQLAGELRALFQNDKLASDPNLPQFRLSAQDLRVELNTELLDAAVTAGPVTYSPFVPERKNWTETFPTAEVRSVVARSSHELYLIPWEGRILPRVMISPAEGGAEVSGTDRLAPRTYVDRDWEPSVDLSRSIQWAQNNPLATICIDGSFILSLWGIDFELADGGRTWLYQSGEVGAPVDEPTGAAGALQSVVQSQNATQIWLFVEAGRFCSPWPSTTETSLFLATAALDSPGPVTLRDLEGQVIAADGAHHIEGQRLTLNGDLHLDVLDAARNHLTVQLSGAIDDAELDGSMVPWMSRATLGVTVTREPGYRAWPLLGLGVIVPAAAGGELIRRYRLRTHMKSLSAQMDAGDYETVAAHADRLIRTRAYGQDASVMKALSLIQLGHVEEARSFLEGLDPWSGPQVATQLYLCAYVHALSGDKASAIQELGACLKASPAYQEEVLANPTFVPMLSDPSLRPLLGLEEAQPSTAGVDKSDLEGYA